MGKAKISINNKSYEGHSINIVIDGSIVESIPLDKIKSSIPVEVTGGLANLATHLSVTVNGDVKGDIHAGGNVTCENIKGDIEAGGNVKCETIDGDVEAGGEIKCQEINGTVDASGNVKCETINGDVEAGGNVKCENIEGDVEAGGSVNTG